MYMFVAHLLWCNKMIVEHTANVWDPKELGTFQALGKITTALKYMDSERKSVYYEQEGICQHLELEAVPLLKN